MKSISIKQPWASLIVHGIKDIENRTWKCPEKYIGKRVLIHASKQHIPFRQINKLVIEHGISCWDEETYPEGMILGSVEIVDCVQNHPSGWAMTGHWNWVLANPIIYANPVEAKGKLSFWEFPFEEIEIECPECGTRQIAVENYTTRPFPTLVHCCTNCKYVITES
ncbi:MAG: ASCH domain-containing protein [Phocaeicola sp.]